MEITIKKIVVPATSRNGRIYTSTAGASITPASSGNGAVGSNPDKYFRYVQGVPSTVWVIQHNLNKYASVTIVDSAGTEVEGEVKHIDENNLIITFSAGFSGFANLN